MSSSPSETHSATPSATVQRNELESECYLRGLRFEYLCQRSPATPSPCSHTRARYRGEKSAVILSFRLARAFARNAFSLRPLSRAASRTPGGCDSGSFPGRSRRSGGQRGRNPAGSEGRKWRSWVSSYLSAQLDSAPLLPLNSHRRLSSRFSI